MLIEIPNVLTPMQLKQIQDKLAHATFIDGKLSAGSAAQRQKNNEELPPNSQLQQELNALVMNNLLRHPIFQSAVLPHRVGSPFYVRYSTGMHYGEHLDDPIMGPMGQQYRSDVSTSLFLNEPDDYQGGELVIKTQFGQQKIKLAAGSAIVYSSTSRHHVAKVTAGERLAAVTWSQSLIRDPDKRQLLYELSLARDSLLRSAPESQESQYVDSSYMNLMRMWSEL
ncbi:MAG: Fe2+-dependent dioxygenase [Gammaproteobacteria bacterium]|nr:Fe2+-dependent dioxygenase [Gammaproteobacteria bacterium]